MAEKAQIPTTKTGGSLFRTLELGGEAAIAGGSELLPGSSPATCCEVGGPWLDTVIDPIWPGIHNRCCVRLEIRFKALEYNAISMMGYNFLSRNKNLAMIKLIDYIVKARATILTVPESEDGAETGEKKGAPPPLLISQDLLQSDASHATCSKVGRCWT